MPRIRSSRAVFQPTISPPRCIFCFRGRSISPRKFLSAPTMTPPPISPISADPQTHCNFTDWTKNLSYSFANPYPGSAATDVGYRLTNHLRGDFPVAADLNPGVKPPRSPMLPPRCPAQSPGSSNTPTVSNHEQDGQNVLYADGHVTFQHTCLCGIGQDNIFTNQSNQVPASPVNSTDAVLLPAN